MSIVAGCRCTVLQKEWQHRLSWLMPGLLISKKNLTSQAVIQSPSFRRMQTLQVFCFNYEMCSCILLFYGGINVLGYDIYVAYAEKFSLFFGISTAFFSPKVIKNMMSRDHKPPKNMIEYSLHVAYVPSQSLYSSPVCRRSP